jgi:hypothetical protein
MRTKAQVWISGCEAKRLASWQWYRLLRESLLGNIRTLIEPGRRIRYSRSDVERLATGRKTRPGSSPTQGANPIVEVRGRGRR